ncbi:MAG: 50S ribosomal protein L11 methyltransferase [Gemmatimonadota bacterium]
MANDTTSPAPRAWPHATVTLTADAVEEFSVLCFELGSCGLQSEEGPEGVRVRAYFPPEAAVSVVDSRLEVWMAGRAAGCGPVAWGLEMERNWLREWRAHYRPVWVTPRLVVHPPWLPVREQQGQIAISVEPRMAFGTGGHESTQLSLQALESRARPGMRCLDLGTGSGVLAMALVRLGASAVVAVDVDREAVENAGLNAAANLGGQGGRLEVRLGSLEVVPERGFDLAVANLESHLLRPLLGPLGERLREGGVAVLSGILRSEERTFAAAMADCGLLPAGRWQRHEWVCLAALREGES